MDPPNQPDQFGDGSDDLELSMITDNLETVNTTTKRAHDGTPVLQPILNQSTPVSSSAATSSTFSINMNTTTTAADFFNSALGEKLKKVDPNQILCIHKYASQYSADKKVKEFCDKLQFLNYVPTVPSQAEIKNIKSVTVKHELSTQCKSDCLSSLVSYFQNAYFINNMENAIINRVSLVNVIAPVYQPVFAFSPQVGLETLTKIRQTCSLSLQGAACENAVFIKEMLLISTAHLIYKELLVKFKNLMDLRKEVQSHLHLLYVKAKIEYFIQCKPKSFDWANKPNIINHVQPDWRKRNTEPPQVPFNRHAQKIIKRVRDGNESFNPETVGNDYSKFLADGEKLVESFKRRKQSQQEAMAPTPPPPITPAPPKNLDQDPGTRKNNNVPGRRPPPPQSSSNKENGPTSWKGKRFGLARVTNNKSRKPQNPSYSAPFSTLTDEIA